MKKITVIVADQHPLMLNGIKSSLSEHLSLYNVAGLYNDLPRAIRKCNELNADILVLGEFPSFLAGTQLIRWVDAKLFSTKIIAYMENTPCVTSSALLHAGVNGCVWKSSPEYRLKEALIKVDGGHHFFDETLLDINLPDEDIMCQKNLTNRETQVLQLIAHGLTNKEIAKKLFLSNKTIESHRLNLMKKLQVHNSIELLKAALKIGVCTL